MFIAEVVETRTAFKPNQKDEEGNVLPLGSIQIRIGSHQTNIGQVRNLYARPAGFQRRIPLIGEQVIVQSAPVNDWSTAAIKNVGYIYFSPINTTDDLVLHAFPKLWKRTGLASSSNSGERKADKNEWGYTFPKNPKKIHNIQPFEGDDIFEGRFGQSIRFGSTVEGDVSIYAEKPNWKGGSNTDPIIIIRNTTAPGSGNDPKYTIEDIDLDDSSIYLTSSQKLTKLAGGFNKNLDVKQLSTYSTTPQIVINSGRVVMNATQDIAFLVGKEGVIVTGKTVVLQSDKYKVNLDDLIDYIKSHVDLDADLAQGSAMYATAAGPTSTATNIAEFIKLKTVDFQTFKLP